MSGRDIDRAEASELIRVGGEKVTLSFESAEGTSEEDIIKLVRAANRLGFSLTGPGLVSVPDEDELMARHLERTYPPTSVSQYLGREHFKVVTEETGRKPSAGSRLFTELIFPVVGIRPFAHAYSDKTAGAKALTHDELGLVVVNRDKAGLEVPPKKLANSRMLSHRERYYKTVFPGAVELNDAAVQIEGLLKLPEKEELVAAVCTGRSSEILSAIVGRVEQLI